MPLKHMLYQDLSTIYLNYPLLLTGFLGMECIHILLQVNFHCLSASICSQPALLKEMLHTKYKEKKSSVTIKPGKGDTPWKTPTVIPICGWIKLPE